MAAPMAQKVLARYFEKKAALADEAISGPPGSGTESKVE